MPAALAALEAELAEATSGPRLMEHVRRIARWRRHAGTAEEREAFDYPRAVLDGYGYATRLLVHDAYISLPVAARIEWAGGVTPALAHSFSRSAPPGGLDGELVAAGAGRPADYAGVDPHGRIVLLDGVASPGAALEASRRGALAQVHVSPHEHVHDMCVSPIWGSPTDEDLERLPATVIVSVTRADGEALRAALVHGPVRLRVFAEVDTAWRQTPILQADLPGRDPATWLMFSGHYCSWYEGAMDNAGANATMLEVARLVARHRDRWERGLRLLFWSGHSQGRYSGSTWYADAYREEIADGCVGHVNVDSTGGRGNTIVADTTAMAETGALADAILRAYAEQGWSGRRMQRAGDQSFWGIGVSCLFANMSEQPARPDDVNASAAVFGAEARAGAGTGWWWHTPHDTVDKIDETILVRDTRIYLAAVWRWLTAPVLPLDFAAASREVREALETLATASRGRFDLSLCLERAAAVEALAARLNAHAGRVAAAADRGAPEAQVEAARINRCLLALQRTLVPIRYTRAGPFDQDPALSLPPLPGLDDVRRLGTLAPDDDEARHLTVRLMRARNRVADALRRAAAELDACLTDLGSP
ncbi:MAG: M28 family peptidase [Armatimonadota bacterium]|nr:M28 family peptidase [Armatimonadota bacterium]